MTQLVPESYGSFLETLKYRVQNAQTKASMSVNRELVLLYWRVGKDILEKQNQAGWGAKVIDQLSKDLRNLFPDTKGFSSRNLKYMRAFAETWTDESTVQGVLAQITWYHNIALMEKLATIQERQWYAQKTIENGWSRNVLVHHIETKLFERQGKAITNFDNALPAPQSELAQQVLKDPYIFDFLTLGESAKERDLERALLNQLQAFLLELGHGFAFMGSQYHLNVGDKDYYLDLLFYHHQLRCLIAIDLKIGEFTPEYAGKMNFYLSALDDTLKHPDDQPAIGIILCRSKDGLTAEYALRGMRQPIGVSTYKLRDLPAELQRALPTVEQLEQALKINERNNDDITGEG